jgi:hypothetical protein
MDRGGRFLPFPLSSVNPERQHFLNLRSKPGKLTAEEAAWHLGFLAHEIPMLTAAGLLKPLGQPPENGFKFFALTEVDELKQDAAWLAKACDAIVKYWKDRNLQRPTKNAKAKWPHKRLGGAIRTGQGPKPLSPRPNRPIKK